MSPYIGLWLVHGVMMLVLLFLFTVGSYWLLSGYSG